MIDFHPVSGIFPMMSEREFADLTDDIEQHGLREPVWLHSDGRIIDGRNRYNACRKLGIDPATRTYGGDDAGLVPFVLSLNLHRRHLNESQRAMVAARIANLPPGRPGKAANLPGIAQAEAAERLQISERSVRDAKKVQEEGSPFLVTAVDGGRIAVSTAATLTELPPAKQRELIDADDKDAIVRAANRIKAERREKRQEEKAQRQRVAEQISSAQIVEQAPQVQPGEWWQLGPHRLYCGDSAHPDFIAEAHGASFAFADPPYNAGKAEWDSGFVWRHDYLTDAAEITVVTPGISAIADFYAGTAMPYRWSLAAWITNGMTRGALGFGNWIYMALFSAKESIHRNAQDHLRITVNAATTGETNHASRKPAALLVELLDLFTATGDLVVDPFLGSGTTLFAAEQSGRRCVGAELDPQHCREIIARYGPEARLL